MQRNFALVQDSIPVAVRAEPGRDIAFVRYTVAVAVVARTKRNDIEPVKRAVSVAVDLALVRNTVSIRIQAGTRGDVAIIRELVDVAVDLHARYEIEPGRKEQAVVVAADVRLAEQAGANVELEHPRVRQV